MKKFLVYGLIAIVVLSLVASFVIPVFAQGPEGGEAAPATEEAWEAMHETCEDGDWEAMEEAAEEIHGEDFSDMPCHDESYDGSQVSTGRWSGGMGSGMMGGGWGGMTGGMY